MRNHPRYATAESTIIATTRTLNTADSAMCIVSLNPVAMSRELIAQMVWVVSPTTTKSTTSRIPIHRRLLGVATRRMPTPNASNSTLWTRITVTISGRTGDPNALSSLIA